MRQSTRENLGGRESGNWLVHALLRIIIRGRLSSPNRLEITEQTIMMWWRMMEYGIHEASIISADGSINNDLWWISVYNHGKTPIGNLGKSQLVIQFLHFVLYHNLVRKFGAVPNQQHSRTFQRPFEGQNKHLSDNDFYGSSHAFFLNFKFIHFIITYLQIHI